MKQEIDLSLWQEFEQEQKKDIKKLEAKVSNSGTKPPKDSWTEKVVTKVRISDLASERNIDSCPEGHILYFDDSRGFFCCAYVKWGESRGKKTKCFSGGIVQFVEWLMEEGLW